MSKYNLETINCGTSKMKNFKILDNLPVLPLYEEFNQLIESGKLQWNRRDQICINSVAGHETDTEYGVGSLILDWKKSKKLKDGSLSIPNRDKVLKEEDFTELCTLFVGTVFEDLYNILNQTYKIGRIRIMNLDPKECLSWHSDPSPRLHFPLKTQEGCLMIIEDEVFHLPINKWCLTDTTKYHTALNGSIEPRLHLVAAIL